LGHEQEVVERAPAYELKEIHFYEALLVRDSSRIHRMSTVSIRCDRGRCVASNCPWGQDAPAQNCIDVFITEALKSRSREGY
jgi:hypothetical protein